MALNHFIIASILILNFISLVSNFELLVYNEEVIIVICFVLFLAFAYKTIGVSISSDLDHRASKIQDEMAKSISSWKSLQCSTIRSWFLVIMVSAQVGLIFEWSRDQVKTLSSTSSVVIYRTLVTEISGRLSVLLSQESSLRSLVSSKIVTAYFSFLDLSHRLNLSSFLFSNILDQRDLLLSNSIDTLKEAYASRLTPSSISLASRILTVEKIIVKLASGRA